MRTWVLYLVLLVLGVLYAGVTLKLGADRAYARKHPQVRRESKPVFWQFVEQYWPNAQQEAMAQEETAVGVMPHYASVGLQLISVWLGGMVVLFVLGQVFSVMTLRLAEKHAGQPGITPPEAQLRFWYAQLIECASLYYYLSLPLVVLLILALLVGVVFMLFNAHRLSPWRLKLYAGIFMGALITIYKLLHSLLIKARLEDPGRALRPAEVPALYQLSKEVAHAVGTRAVDEIRLLPGTTLAVYERGNWRDRQADRSQRVLLLGLALLEGLTQNQFRAVLAHEYGHFQHRDTAGGEVALRVQYDMHRFAQALAQTEQDQWWNPGYLFVRIYSFVYRRLSHGATRLHEIHADRVAVLTCGPEAFNAGLGHVVRRSVEFAHFFTRKIGHDGSSRHEVENLYGLHLLKTDQDEQKIEAAWQKALNTPTTADDTHPSPVERFRYAQRLRGKYRMPPDGELWDLLGDREPYYNEMSAMFNRAVVEGRALELL